VEAWLRRAVSVTGDWVLEPPEQHRRGPAPLGDRLRARYQPANLPPVVLKSLPDILNPMPKALVVIENLLAYFDRADLASQFGIPRPPFLTADGQAIFPEDEPWWLTELSERKKAATEQPGDDDEAAAGPGDEDGPASADEGPAGAGQMSDSDPDSEGEPPADDKPGLGRDPKLAWLERRRRREAAAAAAKVEASMPRPNKDFSSPCSPLRASPAPPAAQYRGYFERQVAGRCGMHALNNALGFAFAGEEDLAFACDEWLRASHHEGLPEVRARHMNAHGWYSIEVMSTCLNTTAMRVRGRIQYELCFEPLRFRPESLLVAVGALVNIDGRHWVALRFLDGVVWLLDSLEAAARPLEWSAYVNFVREQRNQNAFPIFTL
jgi:Josephin